jgi:hypothetical protein
VIAGRLLANAPHAQLLIEDHSDASGKLGHRAFGGHVPNVPNGESECSLEGE